MRGRFFLAERTSAFMLMGEIHLDLRGAVFLVPEPSLRVTALVGNLRVLVPSGVQVTVDQRSLFGGRTITTYGPPATRLPAAPSDLDARRPRERQGHQRRGGVEPGAHGAGMTSGATDERRGERMTAT